MSEMTAEEAEKIAEALPKLTESMQGIRKSYALLGAAFAGAAGAIAGYYVAYRRLETKYNKIAEDEITVMREHYRMKARAMENTVAKPQLEDLVREQGYSTEAPMAVTPPDSVVDAAKEDEREDRPSISEVSEEPESEVRNIFEEAQVDDTWDYHQERVGRSPNKPYVIHIDERGENQAYDESTLTYYEEDDVLCNDSDEVLDHQQRDLLIGEANLKKFGHGSGDASIVYIRNDRLEMQMEVVRSPNSYAEEVHGFQHSVEPYPRLRKNRASPPYDDE